MLSREQEGRRPQEARLPKGGREAPRSHDQQLSPSSRATGCARRSEDHRATWRAAPSSLSPHERCRVVEGRAFSLRRQSLALGRSQSHPFPAHVWHIVLAKRPEKQATIRISENLSSYRSSRAVRISVLATMTPNPSIEEVHKRLRFLCTLHVKRWASQRVPRRNTAELADMDRSGPVCLNSKPRYIRGT